MTFNFAAVADARIVELSSSDIALVSGGGYEWGIQPPAEQNPPSTDNYDWC